MLPPSGVSHTFSLIVTSCMCGAGVLPAIRARASLARDKDVKPEALGVFFSVRG